MRNFIYSLLLILPTIAVTAQSFEINLGYGAPSIYSSAVFSSFTMDEPSKNGVIAASFLVNSPNERWAYGADFTLELFQKTKQISKQNSTGILPTVRYYWSKPESNFRLYSATAIGLVFRKTEYVNKQFGTNNENVLGVNLTPIGIRYGKEVGFFLEGNVGAKGIVQGGISLRMK